MKFKTLRIAATVMALGASSQLALADSNLPDFKFSGFGTLGVVSTNTGDALFRANSRQQTGADNSNPDLGVDSRLGLQADVKFNETFSGVGQALISRRDGEFAGELEWLFGQAKVNDWASVRLGRMVLPTFLVSDSRSVGYASHWLRAPIDTYGTYIPTSFDGAQAVFRNTVAGANVTTQLSLGQSKSDLFAARNGAILPGKVDYSELYSLNVVAEKGDFTVRFGHTLGKDTEVRIGGALVGKGDDSFTGLGLQYDNGSLLVVSEYVKRGWSAAGAGDKFFNSNAYYLSSGYRFGAFMPYVTLSRFEPKGGIYGAVKKTHSTDAVGVRWDVMKNVAVKAQYEEVKGSSGVQWLPKNSAFNGNTSNARVTSFAVDFVF